MSPKRGYLPRVVLASLAAGALALVLRFPLFPLSTKTKLSLGYHQESLQNISTRVSRYGLIAQEYTVETDDGYILTLHRIRSGVETKGAPVFMMHGLLQSAASLLDAGPDAALPYLLAKDHDIWLGNTRGSHYSRKHKTLNPDTDPAYWQFCVDEIGRYDLPAFVDKVLNVTGSEQLNYIGYSQGAGSFFIMCSELPHYCDKIKLMVALAPAGRQKNTKSKLYRTFLQTFESLEPVLNTLGVQEVFSKGSLSQEFLEFFCQLSSLTTHLCDKGKDVLDSIYSLHPGSVSDDTIKALFGNFPVGTSVHNLARYGQSMRSENFHKFDYGKKKNLELYNSEVPPNYNLTAAEVPVVAIYGRNDGLVDQSDVEWLLKQLPNLVEAVLVKDPLWNHLDVAYSQYTGEMVFPKINEYLKKYNAL